MRISRNRLLLLVSLVVALAAMRFVHIEADTPRWLTTWSLGVFVDEGYKTLDARNLVQFGSARWHPKDDYAGWIDRSPLMQGSYYAAFRLMGAHIASARAVTTMRFCLLLAGFFLAHSGRYRTWLLTSGLVLLGIQHTIFFFSRIALYEIPLTVCLYGLLFTLAGRRKPRRSTLVVFGAFFAAANFGIKHTAPLYFVPVAIGLLVAYKTARGWKTRATLIQIVATAVVLGVGAWLTRDTWADRFQFVRPDYFDSLIWSSTLMHSSTALIAVGLACAFHALLVEPRLYLGSPYRAGLIALTLLGLPAVSLSVYAPLRYYIPFLPAYLLLVIEWVHMRTWRSPMPARVRWPAYALIPLLVWCLCCVGLTLKQYVPSYVPLWSDSALALILRSEYIAAGSILLGIALFVLRRKALSGAKPLVAIGILLALAGLRDLRLIGSFMLDPTYDGRDIARDLERSLPPGTSIAGNWAPQLTLGTSHKALYMNRTINRPRRILSLRPDYLLHSQGFWDPRGPLQERGKVRLGEPVKEWRYAGRTVTLIPFEYENDNGLAQENEQAKKETSRTPHFSGRPDQVKANEGL